jgi:lysozyme family protein
MQTQTRSDIVVAMNVLVRRRSATVDTAEQAVIDASLDTLAGLLQQLNQAALLDAAAVVAQATDALERVVASARMGPFDTFLADIQGAIAKLNNGLGAMQGIDRLAKAPELKVLRGAPAVAPGSPQAAAGAAVVAPAVAAAAGAVPTPINSTRYDDLRAEYADFFARCALRDGFAGNVEFYVSRLLKSKAVYQQTGAPLGVPWAFIGVVHGMECGFNFQTHLHNGDPLSRRTVQVPRGRPATGNPPFTWVESARDALTLKRLNEVADWGIPRMLYQLESYNGFGYRPRGVPTPYLWSFSTLYSAGKFIADRVFDPAAVSKQCGAALMIKALQQRGAL